MMKYILIHTMIMMSNPDGTQRLERVEQLASISGDKIVNMRNQSQDKSVSASQAEWGTVELKEDGKCYVGSFEVRCEE